MTIACYRINPKLKVAVEGYAFKQTTDDKVNGSDIGFKGQAFALGQAFNMPIKLVYRSQILKETEVEYRPEGHTSWLKLIWAF